MPFESENFFSAWESSGPRFFRVSRWRKIRLEFDNARWQKKSKLRSMRIKKAPPEIPRVRYRSSLFLQDAFLSF